MSSKVIQLNRAGESLTPAALELQKHHRSGNTSLAYAGYVERFKAYLLTSGQECGPLALVNFLTALYHGQYALNTITGYYSGIVDTWPDLRGDVVSKQLSAIRLKLINRPAKQTNALSIEDAERCLASMGDSLTDHRNRAMLAVAWVTASRKSELLSLTVSNIVHELAGYEIVVKLKGADKLTKKWIPGAVGDLTVALGATTYLNHWLKASEITSGPVWRKINKSGRIEDRALSASGFDGIFKRIIKAAGLDASLYSPHSVRTGFVTYASQQGHGMPETMAVTGHKCFDSIKPYFEEQAIRELHPMGAGKK